MTHSCPTQSAVVMKNVIKSSKSRSFASMHQRQGHLTFFMCRVFSTSQREGDAWLGICILPARGKLPYITEGYMPVRRHISSSTFSTRSRALEAKTAQNTFNCRFVLLGKFQFSTGHECREMHVAYVNAEGMPRLNPAMA